jgi:hypothetical protein
MIGQDCEMTSFRRNFNMKNSMEDDTRMMMTTLILQAYEKKGMFKNITIGESTSQYDKKKKMRKVKSFESHKFGHYAEQCLNKNKGGNEIQLEVAALTKNQIDEFCEKFE